LPTPKNENYNIWIPAEFTPAKAGAGMTVYPHESKNLNDLPLSFPWRRESMAVYVSFS